MYYNSGFFGIITEGGFCIITAGGILYYNSSGILYYSRGGILYYDSLFVAACRDCQETKLEESMKDKELQEKLYKASQQWTKVDKKD